MIVLEILIPISFPAHIIHIIHIYLFPSTTHPQHNTNTQHNHSNTHPFTTQTLVPQSLPSVHISINVESGKEIPLTPVNRDGGFPYCYKHKKRSMDQSNNSPGANSVLKAELPTSIERPATLPVDAGITDHAPWPAPQHLASINPTFHPIPLPCKNPMHIFTHIMYHLSTRHPPHSCTLMLHPESLQSTSPFPSIVHENNAPGTKTHQDSQFKARSQLCYCHTWWLLVYTKLKWQLTVNAVTYYHCQA